MTELTFEHETESRALETAFEARDPDAIQAALDTLTLSEATRVLLALAPDQRTELLELVSAEVAAELIEQLPSEQAAELVVDMEEERAADILEEMDAADRVDIMHDLDEDYAAAILARMEPEEAEEVRALSDYEDDVAGGLMTLDILKFKENATVGQVIRHLVEGEEDFEHYQSQHPYVVDGEGRLIGVVSLRKILASKRGLALTEVMAKADSVSVETRLEDLEDVFADNPYLSIPVTNDGGVLIGAVSRDAVADAVLERSERDALKSSGVVGDELRSMPTIVRARRRLAWLTINIGLNILAASIISTYEETLAAVIALAIFLPMVSDMSGCTGNQAVAVSLRELSLGVTRPTDVLRVWLKEISVGLINGIALGILIGIVAWVWKSNPYIGLVVGLALSLNTLIAVSVGGLVPLLLKRRNIDPAVASGPMLTTITDMCGFFLVLSIATAMMPLLVSN